MKKVFFYTLFYFVLSIRILAQASMDNVWLLFENQDLENARSMLNDLVKQPATQTDAFFTLMMLNTLEGKENNLALMQKIMPLLDDPSPYLYALWFSEAVMKDYNKKSKERLAFLKSLLNDPKVNPSLKACVQYMLGLHYTFANSRDNQEYFDAINSINDWQFVGLFDNTSRSGFDKNYPPIADPTPTARFKSRLNSDIHWFKPEHLQRDGWVGIESYMEGAEGIIYAQTFVQSSTAKNALLGIGFSGNIKVWVNDQLVISEEEEQISDIDLIKVPIQLAAGNNRILVQLGYSRQVDSPNFTVRLLDEKSMPLKDVKINSTYAPYTKATATTMPKALPHFAESYFEKLQQTQPNNPIPACFLAFCHKRRGLYNKAIAVEQKVLEKYPKNAMFNYNLLNSYIKQEDRTQMLSQIELLRSYNPNLVLFDLYDIQSAFKSGDYTAAEKHLEHMKEQMEDKSEYYSNYIKLLANQKRVKELFEVIDEAYEAYPDEPLFVQYKYLSTKEKVKNPTASIEILDKFLRSNYNYALFQMLEQELLNAGNVLRAEKLLQNQLALFPEFLEISRQLSNLYYETDRSKSALEYADRCIGNMPFNGTLWYERSFINEAMGKKKEAIEDLKKAVHYNPNLFSAREKLRTLNNQKPILESLSRKDPYETIANALKKESKSDENYEYIFYDRINICFSEGASVLHSTLGLKMLNEEGVKRWQENSIGYGSYQDLTIEKAEVVKKSGQKIAAEQDDNQFVFPSLEVGDGVYIVYRLENYTGGKLSKEFWDSWTFDAFVPIQESTLKVLAHPDIQFDFKNNFDQKPTESSFDEFKMYEWKFKNLPPCKSENYMPTLVEVGKSIYMSTVKDWKTIADWYSDTALPMAKEDYNLESTYKKIFDGNTFASDYDKAKAIYNYIGDNIKYSSVPFRQSSYTPQKPMVTISTQLGDCKDLSVLYHTLARKAGLKTHLVLVNTRDNGEETIQLPSIDFNHCIVKIDLPDGILYQELTDSDLPFGAIPANLINAQALVIPNNSAENEGKSLIHIPNQAKILNQLKRKTQLQVQADQVIGSTTIEAIGERASEYRHHFNRFNKQETQNEVLSMLNDAFKNELKLKKYDIQHIDNRNNNFVLSSDFSVADETVNIGGMKAVKVPFFDHIFTASVFTDETREYPIFYWAYEPTNMYETEVIIEIPAGSKFVDVPTSVAINNAFMQYEIKAQTLSDNKMKITRKAIINTQTLKATAYADFKNCVRDILKAEDMFIAYK